MPPCVERTEMNFLFDLYGTLIDIRTDEEKHELWLGVADMLGESEGAADDLKAEYKSLCTAYAAKRTDPLGEFDLIHVFEDMLLKRALSPADAPKFASRFRALSREKLNTFPGVPEMLSDLGKAGAGVYLVSNAQTCFTLEELDITGLTPLFDGILISSDAGVKKPSTEIFEIARKKFDLSGECVYVGNDMRDDVLGASRAGLRTVYIETEQSGHYPDMDIPSPTYIAKSHSDLAKILLSLATEK